MCMYPVYEIEECDQMVISMVITMVKMATMQHDSAYTIKQITA